MRYQNLNVAAEKANLNPTQKKQVETLSSLLDTHKNLLDLPEKQAQQNFQNAQALANPPAQGGQKG